MLFSLHFRAAPSSVAAIRLNHSASPVQEVSPIVLFLAQIVAILLGCFVFIPYSCYMVGFLFISIPSPFKPFPCFLLQEQRWWSFREDRETALMRCLHHLRAASGEWLNIHVGLVATTPLFEEETYRKVSSSLAPMQYTGVCRIAQLPNEGGYWASGERSSFHGTCAVWKERSI